MRQLRIAAIPVAIALVAAACGGGAAPGGPASPSPAAAVTDPCKKVTFEVQTYMAQIQRIGKLKAGVREDTPPMGRKNPQTNRFEGFDIDIAREMAKAIFNVGDEKVDECLEYIPVVSATRIPSLNENKVDMVVATMTITEARKKEIDFSDVYYRDGQRMLVKKDNTSVTKPEDMNGKTVCAARGSTSERQVSTVAPRANKLLLASYAECLTALRNNQTEVISTDEAILMGLLQQDPNTKIVGRKFSEEPLGIGAKKGRVAFVDFLNRTLARMITDGTWKKIYDKHIKPLSGRDLRTPDEQ